LISFLTKKSVKYMKLTIKMIPLLISEDYIMKDTSSKIYNENKNFVVWSGSYNETTKRYENEKKKKS